MFRFYVILSCYILICSVSFGQSPSFQTYVNPVIPGDHPDPTLTKIGDYFYTSGSSFNPTPKIYRSTDLVHWEVIAQPVSASWSAYGDRPAGGAWGGHMVLYNGVYWHFFGKGSMFFVTADQPEGPWSTPTRMNVPASMPAGFGVDNSIFIDEDTGKWYLLTKAGHENNHIVELGDDGQSNGNVLDLTWLNPTSEGNPYGWAEGPVMWKAKGYYYYSFAQHLAGAQYVMRSETLTDDESAWTIIGENIFTGTGGIFPTPNHISPVVMLDDGTSWTIGHSNHSSSWHAQGRQGLLFQVTYTDQDFPVIQSPSINAVQAPDLPSGGVPWMVPKSDMFNDPDLKPEWSFLGYTPDRTWSLTDREGWLYLESYHGSNTVIQNDGEHSYSLITRLDFEPESSSDEAGLRIINGPETHHAKVFSTVNDEGEDVFALSFQNTRYETENMVGSIAWLKMIRDEHMITGYYSADGLIWIQIGEAINAGTLDTEKPNYNDFTGNQQGPYVEGGSAYFDLYIYRDAYTDISANNPANRNGVSPGTTYLANINDDEWAMYAGVMFGSSDEGSDYMKYPEQIHIYASSNASGGTVEVWLDSIDTGQKIAEVVVENTGGWRNYETFSASVDEVSGSHDVYLRFKGVEGDRLLRMKTFKFNDEQIISSVEKRNIPSTKPASFSLDQNYPNPFNPTTMIHYTLAKDSEAKIVVYDPIGNEVATLVNTHLKAGDHRVEWNTGNIASGIYIYKLITTNFVQSKKMTLIK